MCRPRKRAHSFSGITKQADTHNKYLSLPACYTGNDRIPIAFPPHPAPSPPYMDASRSASVCVVMVQSGGLQSYIRPVCAGSRLLAMVAFAARSSNLSGGLDAQGGERGGCVQALPACPITVLLACAP